MNRELYICLVVETPEIEKHQARIFILRVHEIVPVPRIGLLDPRGLGWSR